MDLAQQNKLQIKKKDLIIKYWKKILYKILFKILYYYCDKHKKTENKKIIIIKVKTIKMKI